MFNSNPHKLVPYMFSVVQNGFASLVKGEKAVFFDKNLVPRQVFSDVRSDTPRERGTRQMVHKGDIGIQVRWDRRYPDGLYRIIHCVELNDPSKSDNIRRDMTSVFTDLSVDDVRGNEILDKLLAKYDWLDDWLRPQKASVVRLPREQFPPHDHYVAVIKRSRIGEFMGKYGIPEDAFQYPLIREKSANLFLEPQVLNFNPDAYTSEVNCGKELELWFGSDGDGVAHILEFMPTVKKDGESVPGSIGIKDHSKHRYLIMVRHGIQSKQQGPMSGIMVKVFDVKTDKLRQVGHPRRRTQTAEA